MPGPHVSVVVVTYNSARHLDGFLGALDAAADGVDYELVVADNASADDTTPIVRAARPDAVLVDLGANRGYAAGVNAGIAAAHRQSAVLVCNPDVRLGASAMRHLLDALQRPNAGITAPRTSTESGQLVHSVRRDATVRRVLGEAVLGGTRACKYAALSQIVGDEREYDYAHPVEWASGAVLMCSRACIDAVGPWDESFFLYSEEVDF